MGFRLSSKDFYYLKIGEEREVRIGNVAGR